MGIENKTTIMGGMDDEFKARIAGGAGFAIFGCCVTVWCIPMMIAYYMFAYKNKDPEACYVN